MPVAQVKNFAVTTNLSNGFINQTQCIRGTLTLTQQWPPVMPLGKLLKELWKVKPPDKVKMSESCYLVSDLNTYDGGDKEGNTSKIKDKQFEQPHYLNHGLYNIHICYTSLHW